MDQPKRYRQPLKTFGFHPLSNLMSFSLSLSRFLALSRNYLESICSDRRFMLLSFFAKLHFCANLLRISQFLVSIGIGS